MSKAKRSHPMKHFFILIYSLWNKYGLLIYQSINHPAYEEGSYYTTAEAKLQSCLVWICVRTYLRSVTGGSAAWSSQFDLLLPSGFWTTSLIRSHVDQSIWLEHSIVLQLQGLRAVLCAWRVHLKKGRQETWGTCHRISPVFSQNTKKLLLIWEVACLSGFASNQRDLCTLILFVSSPTLTKVEYLELASAAKNHNRCYFCSHTDSWIMFYTYTYIYIYIFSKDPMWGCAPEALLCVIPTPIWGLSPWYDTWTSFRCQLGM